MIPHSRPTLGPEEKEAVCEVLDSCQIAQGIKTAQFEQKFCKWTGRRYAVAVSSGTSALMLALTAMGLSRGDEVLVPSFVCSALLHSAAILGVKPVPVDINPEDFNLDPDKARRKIRLKTRAVIAASMFGRICRMQDLLKIGIPVIEDATQSLGASLSGKPAGSFGALSVFSFYATKMITTGEGGMILTDSRRLAERLRDLRDYDKKKNYRLRMNAKMTNFQAAMGLAQLKKLPGFIQTRRQMAAWYRKVLSDFPCQLPVENEDRDHVYSRFVIRFEKGAAAFLKNIRKRGIDAKRPVFRAAHQELGLKDSDFPETKKAMQEACSLPIYPSMTSEERKAIESALLAQKVDGRSAANPRLRPRVPLPNLAFRSCVPTAVL